MPTTVLGTDEIREILARRIDQQKQAVGMVVGVIEPECRRVVAELLRQRHKIQPGQTDDFMVRNMTDVAQTSAQITTLMEGQRGWRSATVRPFHERTTSKAGRGERSCLVRPKRQPSTGWSPTDHSSVQANTQAPATPRSTAVWSCQSRTLA